jgi:hypothetical protein
MPIKYALSTDRLTMLLPPATRLSALAQTQGIAAALQ